MSNVLRIKRSDGTVVAVKAKRRKAQVIDHPAYRAEQERLGAAVQAIHDKRLAALKKRLQEIQLASAYTPPRWGQ